MIKLKQGNNPIQVNNYLFSIFETNILCMYHLMKKKIFFYPSNVVMKKKKNHV